MYPIGGHFHLLFVNEAENIAIRNRLRLEYRRIRDTSDPFQVSDFLFIKLYRLPKLLVGNLIEEIREISPPPVRNTSIPLHIQTLICLAFFANGSYQTAVGQCINITVSQPSVSRIINNLINIFTNHLLQRYVKFPNRENTIQEKINKFHISLNFPTTIGAIDCTHLAIKQPNDTNETPSIAYLNRKGFYSINVQAICDADMLFLNVNARYPGATHDSAIWETSTINSFLKRRYENGSRYFCIIGDSGYPIQPWLITPITDAVPDTPEGVFSARHCSARNIIERTFGVLKQRFRCLLKHRVLHYDHPVAAKIFYSCVVLHNICRKNKIPELADEIVQENEIIADNPFEINVPVNDSNLTE